jgi:uncharacterized membrane protein
MLNGIIGVVTVCYPFLVWFSLDYLQPRYLASALAGLVLLRLLNRNQSQQTGGSWPLVFAACALFLLVIALTNESGWLLAYPVFVSLLFFAVFAYSLFHPPTVVERLARLEDPDLPPKGVAYTRKVTRVWSGFFLINAAISMATVWYGERWVWSLYNGGVSYVLMGLLMAGEMAVRRKVRASY